MAHDLNILIDSEQTPGTTAAPTPARPTSLTRILELADTRNLRVHPVKRNKTPLLKGWPSAASTSPAVITEWAERFPNCNWGIALDADTMVVDCDDEQAVSALCDLGEVHGGLQSTLTTLTGRGFHLWFHVPKPVSNRVGVMPGIDVRTKGGFVVVPPSIHDNGVPYEFAWNAAPIADAPEWLFHLVTAVAPLPAQSHAKSAVKAVTVPIETTQDQAQDLTPFEKDNATRGWDKRLAPRMGRVPDGRSPFSLRILLEPQSVTTGMRNLALYSYLCRLRREGKTDALIRSEAWRVVARIPEPMSRHEVEKIISNAMNHDASLTGDNALVQAWRTVEQIVESQGTGRWYRFLLLIEQLVGMRPETKPTILLPLKAIGILMSVHFTQVSKWRNKAMELGFLCKKSAYVRRRLADEFTVKAGFSPLADGPELHKLKRGRPRKPNVELVQAG